MRRILLAISFIFLTFSAHADNAFWDTKNHNEFNSAIMAIVNVIIRDGDEHKATLPQIATIIQKVLTKYLFEAKLNHVLSDYTIETPKFDPDNNALFTYSFSLRNGEDETKHSFVLKAEGLNGKGNLSIPKNEAEKEARQEEGL